MFYKMNTMLDKYWLAVFLFGIIYFTNGEEEGSKVIKIGVILPEEGPYPFCMNKTVPAIQYAIESVENMTDILQGYKFSMMYGDSECSETMGPLRAIDMYYKDSVNLFLGPSCDFSVSAVARFSPHWSVPVMTAGALVQQFKDKSQYKLLTRMSGSYDKLGDFFVKVFKQFDWVITAMIYHDQPPGQRNRSTCYFTMKGIHQSLKQHYLEHYRGKIWNKAFDENLMEKDELRSILQEASKNARIIVLCASPDSIREVMINAAELGYDNGEYVFISADLFGSEKQDRAPWRRDNDTTKRNELAKRGYEALMAVTLHQPESEEYKKFSVEVKDRANSQYGNDTYGDEEVNSFVQAFHDAVILYSLALNETLADGYKGSDGSQITTRMWNRTFQGITGTVSIDDNGDRNMDYSLLDFNPDLGKFEVTANYYGNKKQYEEVEGKQIHWPGGQQGPPPDTPKCDFDGSLCPPDEPFPKYALAIIGLSSLLPLVGIFAFLMLKRRARQWKQAQIEKLILDWDSISFGDMKKLSRFGSRTSLRSEIFGDPLIELRNKQIFIRTGSYKDKIVAIKEFDKPYIHPEHKNFLLDFTQMIDIQNNHVVAFIGACLEPPNQCIVTEYCSRGSLEDVLENDKMTLDGSFKASLIQDIVTGMAYLHGSVIRSHGNLKTSNCVVDSHFQLKITDYGLHSLRNPLVLDEEEPYQYYKNKVWTAPELLRMHDPPAEGTQKGDVYSFAIICQEIMYRKGPFWIETMDLTPQEICEKVANNRNREPFRPSLYPYDDCPELLIDAVRQSWNEDPGTRPDFTALKKSIHEIIGDDDNILDNLIKRMEHYADNLEMQVAARTADYIKETKEVERVLHLLLPKSVAKQLMRNQPVVPESFDDVTIYFSDIAGFTKLCSQLRPEEVVNLLHDLYHSFDSIADKLDVYKVETIGDAYMVTSGLPIKNGILHAREISRMSLGILEAINHIKVKPLPHEVLKIRIGVHTGPVLAGVVGIKMPRYCLFGRTVLLASGMESSGKEMKIQISPATKKLLDYFRTFKIEPRDPDSWNLKKDGDREMHDHFAPMGGSYWLLGEETKKLPESIDQNYNILGNSDVIYRNGPSRLPQAAH